MDRGLEERSNVVENLKTVSSGHVGWDWTL